MVVLGNADAAILAEAGGRRVYRRSRHALLRLQPRHGLAAPAGLRDEAARVPGRVRSRAWRSTRTVPDEPIEVPLGSGGGIKWIANYDNQFKGPIPMRQALAESRNAVAVWITREIGVEHGDPDRAPDGDPVPAAAVPLHGARGVGGAAAGTGGRLSRHRVGRPGRAARHRSRDRRLRRGAVRGAAGRARRSIPAPCASIQEGLRGVVRLPDGTAHSLDARGFPVPVMGKTGTTSDFRDALFVGSTYGTRGITVAVRIGFDDNRPLGRSETGGRTALPIFREIMLRVYKDQLVGQAPHFPREIEDGIDQYLAAQAAASRVDLSGQSAFPRTAQVSARRVPAPF